MRTALALVFSLGLGGVAAGETTLIPVAAESGVRIGIHRVLQAQGGYAPLRIVILNLSEREREWIFEFTSYAGSGTTHLSRFVFNAASGDERVFDVVVPLAAPPGESTPLHVRVSGFGVETPTWDQPILQYGYAEEFQYWLGLSQSLQGESDPNHANAFDPALLPSDWRGLVSLSIVALTEDELKSASPQQTTALLEWVARGGRLVRLGSETYSSLSYGLGTVVRSPVPNEPSVWPELLKLPTRRRGVTAEMWARANFESIQTRLGWLLTFLVGYAVLVGPINLFVFCSGGKRARLFWTMPAFAIAACLFLTVIILLQDGLGGSGHRVALVRLVPDITREVVVQEQVSRTGALLKRGFEIDEPVALFDLGTGGVPFRGQFETAASSFGGSWFRSRAVQGQKLEVVRAGRARIEWAGAGRIHSSIEAPLDELFYRDDEGRVFRASGVTPGRDMTLEPAAENEYEKFRLTLMAAAGPSVSEHLDALYQERGTFLARAGGSGKGAAIETLSGIDWKDTVIYSGRIGGTK